MAKKVAKKSAPVKKSTSKTVAPAKGKGKRSFAEVTVGRQYWKPSKVKEVIEGELVEIETKPKYQGKKGETENRVVLKDDEGVEWVLPAHWQLNAAADKMGDGFYRITVIKIGGKADKKTGKNEAYVYSIEHAA